MLLVSKSILKPRTLIMFMAQLHFSDYPYSIVYKRLKHNGGATDKPYGDGVSMLTQNYYQTIH